MPWSNRKPYLGRKQSMSEFFSSRVRFIKESNSKESAFEKPYESSGEYQQMHLNLNLPSWSKYKWPQLIATPFGDIDAAPPEIFGEKFHLFKFAPPSCDSLPASDLFCGGSTVIIFSIWNTPPYSIGSGWTWKTTILSQEATTDDLTINIDPGEGAEALVRVEIIAGEQLTNGALTICVEAKFVGSGMLEGKAVIPDGGPKNYADFIKVSGQGSNSTFNWLQSHDAAFQTTRDIRGTVLKCCREIEVVGCCDSSFTGWDANSNEVAQSSSITITATGTEGGGDDFVWSLSMLNGSGFWLDSGFTTTTVTGATLGVIVYTDAAACGQCILTGVACDGSTPGSGWVINSTAGEWDIYSPQYTCVDTCGTFQCCPPTSNDCTRGGPFQPCRGGEIVSGGLCYTGQIDGCGEAPPCVPLGNPNSCCGTGFNWKVLYMDCSCSQGSGWSQQIGECVYNWICS